MFHKLFRKMGMILCTIGAVLLLCPYLVGFYLDYEKDKVIESFDVSVNQESGKISDSEKKTIEMSREKDALYMKMKAYNERIYGEKQSGIKNSASFEILPEELESIGDEPVGYVEIPSIDVKLPLYIGTTEEHLAKGAAILSNTSMPVGGENTNCVIAAHRGYYSSKYFKDIEQVKKGDTVLVTNLWETRSYTVTGFDIINPQDEKKIRIQEGRELVTLLTCHPYQSNGKFRYLVFCEPESTEKTCVYMKQILKIYPLS